MTSRDYSRLRILHLPVEFPTWVHARPWSYCIGLAAEEGFAAAGMEFTTVTTSWFPRLQEIVGEQRYDQVWVEIAHQSAMPDHMADWIASLAPVRIGLVGESLRFSETERELWPEVFDNVTQRGERVRRLMRYMTHVLAVDEADVAENNSRGLPSMWWPATVPRRYVRTQIRPPGDRAISGGMAYGKRKNYLQHPLLQGLVMRPAGAEDQTILPLLFDGLQQTTESFVSKDQNDWQRSLPVYMSTLRGIRRRSFDVYLDMLQRGCAVLNLPSLGKTYSSRVVEGMAAGRPIISWEIPRRPRMRSVFEDGEDILLFNPDEPAELAAHIERVIRDPALATRITANARRKLLTFHTTEHRVRQILDWSTAGIEPTYV